ncbi:MAG TPA: hypothetical protein VFX14_06095 [Methylomirabilota bacterium]|nr:hypothetical protein [Methylomirabilota bacterium]
MPMEELIAYVVLLSLPLWLLIEQLLHIWDARRSTASRPASQPEPQPERRPERRVPAPPFPEALRSGQR